MSKIIIKKWTRMKMFFLFQLVWKRSGEVFKFEDAFESLFKWDMWHLTKSIKSETINLCRITSVKLVQVWQQFFYTWCLKTIKLIKDDLWFLDLSLFHWRSVFKTYNIVPHSTIFTVKITSANLKKTLTLRVKLYETIFWKTESSG